MAVFIFKQKVWIDIDLDTFIKVLQFLLNFSNCVSLVVALTNLLILLPTKKYSLDMIGFIIVTNKIKVIAQKNK